MVRILLYREAAQVNMRLRTGEITSKEIVKSLAGPILA